MREKKDPNSERWTEKEIDKEEIEKDRAKEGEIVQRRINVKKTHAGLMCTL